MKVTKTEVPEEKQFEKFDLTIRVETYEELVGLTKRLHLPASLLHMYIPVTEYEGEFTGAKEPEFLEELYTKLKAEYDKQNPLPF